MPKKATEPFPLAIAAGTALDLSSAALGSVTPKNRDEDRILGESHKQQVIMAAHSEKAVVAVNEIVKVHSQAREKFVEATQRYEQIYEEVQGSAFEQYLSAYIKHDADALVKHIGGTLEICALSIARQVGESVVPAIETEKPGFWKRVTGDY